MSLSQITICNEQFSTDLDYFSFSYLLHEIPNQAELSKLSAFPKLKGASFSSTNFDDFGIKVLVKACPQISNLNLQDSQISDQGIKYLSALRQLQILRLKENHQLTNQCISGLNLLKQLQDLQIHETSINTEGLLALKLPNLQQLLLNTASISSRAALMSLSKQHPLCRILVKGQLEVQNGAILWEKA